MSKNGTILNLQDMLDVEFAALRIRNIEDIKF